MLLAIILSPGVATAQVDYSAGKTGEQLFNSDCSACHASPQVVGRGRDVRALTTFLGQHYTTKTQWAALIANYIVRARDMPPPAPVTAPALAPASTPVPEQPAKPSNEREAKAVPETLKSKLRSYATVGEEAKALAGPSKD